MSVVRKDPIPPGVFWLDVFAPLTLASKAKDGRPAFRDWIAASDAQILRTEKDDTPITLTPGGPSFRTFFVFEVTGSRVAAFPFRALGFPTVIKLQSAPGGITEKDRRTSSDDTVSRPAPGSAGDIISQWASNLLQSDLRPLVLLGLGAWLYTKLKGR